MSSLADFFLQEMYDAYPIHHHDGPEEASEAWENRCKYLTILLEESSAMILAPHPNTGDNTEAIDVHNHEDVSAQKMPQGQFHIDVLSDGEAYDRLHQGRTLEVLVVVVNSKKRSS